MCINNCETNIAKMKLTNIALTRIDELETRLKLALALKVTERRVSQMIKDNKENGSLTTAVALQVIKKETGLSQSQILETREEKTAA